MTTALRLLVVEDNELNQKLTDAILSQIGACVNFVFTGLEAIEARKQFDYDAILMDIQLPEVSGIEATRRIRDWERQNNKDPVRIVAHTAAVFPDQVDEQFAAGIDVHVPKPSDSQTLLRAILGNQLSGSRTMNAPFVASRG